MNVFLTDPDNPQVREQLKGDIDFKEAVENRLIELGIKLDYARCAVIDLKRIWIPCFKNGLTSDQTANFLLADVKRLYNIEDA